MLEPSTSSSSTTLVGQQRRARGAPRSRTARRGRCWPTARSGSAIRSRSPPRAPSPRDARNRAPVFSSCTTPNDTSPSRASSDGGTTPTDTQHDSSPGRGGTGAVDGVDHEEGARLAVGDEPAVFGVEADVARGLEALLHARARRSRRCAASRRRPGRDPTRARAAAVPRSGTTASRISAATDAASASSSPLTSAELRGLTRRGAARRGRRSSARRSR